MNIVMMTNTYLPHVGGVAHSVERCTLELRRRGHRVLVVCPQFAGAPAVERDVFRIPAIQRFSGTDFSVVLPFTGPLSDILDDFKPDIVHSHHPFLLGHAALRVAARFERPIVFTHHTMYEYYTHYIPADSPQLQEFAAELAVGYGNLCNAVIAPSESLKEILLKRNIRVPVEVIPTGVDLRMFAGSGKGNLRAGLRIPANAFVIGHVGRLAPEKNLQFLCESVLAFMKKERSCHFIVAGDGPSIPGLVGLLKKGGVKNRIHFAGVHTGADLVRFYRTMNAFVFASKSETQGMVLVEAMAASVPVIGLDATGTRDVIEDGVNGFLVRTESRKEFAGAIEKLVRMPEAERKAMIQACARTAFRFSSEASCDRLASLYETLSSTRPRHQDPDKSVWWRTLKRIEAEWEIWNNVAVSLKQGMIRPARWPGRVHARVEKWWGWIRRKLSRIRWARALLQLPEFKSTKADRGLILVQIDGLSRRQFERAMAVRRMPFLKSLITTQGYEAGSFYSGIPSSTPAVQGELFYGVKCCVPAFEFYDRSSGTIRKMSTAEASREIEEKLKQEGEGLLKGGASYSNIFGGGADGVNYCATSIGWSSTFAMVRPARLLLLAIVYFRSTLRVAGLSVIEMLLSLVDSIEGIRQGEHPWKEIKFVPARVSISIALREIITLGACIDIARGVPVILLNFLGYDEQAHRRGPSALFAHWALKGIDGCVRRIFEAGVRSERRHYDLWIYSDHGQEETIPWCRHSDGKAIGSVISQVFQMSTFVDISSPEGIQTTRRSYLEGKRRRVCGKAVKPSQNSIVVAALGPLAHVYLVSTPRRSD